MNYIKYKQEIERILKKTCLEQSMYKTIQNVIECYTNFYTLDISSMHKKNRFHAIYNTKSGMSDIGVFNNKDRLVGLVEVKWLVSTQTSKELERQLVGQCKKFSKLLYTNGLTWKYYTMVRGNMILDWEVTLGTYENKISWTQDTNWKELIVKLSNLKF